MKPCQTNRHLPALAVALAIVSLASACGGGGEETGAGAGPAATGRADSPQHRQTETVAPSHCPSEMPTCLTTSGRIVYVERVDPDGDGDAHFVVVDRQGITLPGITAIDVRKGLRPHPLPEYGDLISAAGPVQTGSHGQSQIHALELHVGG